MLPVLALVGRPNVGKSTLFNRLTATRDALVHDQPGLTRDRIHGRGRLGEMPFIVIDTGGLVGQDAEGLQRSMNRQVEQAIAEADRLLFVLDGRDGLTSGDAWIADYLRRTGKALILVVNKVDGGDADLIQADFFSLGLGAPWPISAAHGRGVLEMLEAALLEFAAPEAIAGHAEDSEDLTRAVQVAIVGRPNVGKSTLVNRLLGEERVVTCDEPGTTRDSILIPFERNGRHYTLVDTAGIRRRAAKLRTSLAEEVIEKFSIIKTMQAIEASHVVILVVDAHQGIGEQDATLAGHVLESGRALVLAVNKWDGLALGARERIVQELDRRLSFLDFARRFTISALHGTGVGHLLSAVDQVYANAIRQLPTPLLTRVLQEAVQAHAPPIARGRRIKLRYAHQGGRNPPLIVIHGNQAESVPDAYRRYLVHRYREAFGLDGTPIRILFRSGENPYEGKHNLLTPRQIRKKKRLMSFVK
ncbi:50S ribosomal subunit stability factor [Gammaproteobacteria bacterium]